MTFYNTTGEESIMDQQIVDDSFSEDTEQIDKDERKRIRRQRVFGEQQKEQEEQNGDTSTPNNSSQAGILSSLKSEAQIAKSLSQLDKKKSNGLLNITEIRVHNDFIENRRRLDEEKRRRIRTDVLKKNEQVSKELFLKLESQLQRANQMGSSENVPPQVFQDEVTALQQSLEETLGKQNDVIEKFRHELKMKDEDYVKSLNRYTKSIEELRLRMKQESKQMENAYKMKTSTIEEAFSQDRQELFHKHETKIKELMEEKQAVERKWIDAQEKRRYEYQKEIDNIQARGDDEYNKLKIKLETDIHKLEHQLEDLQSSYQLNADKLEYNYQVMTETDKESKNTIKKQKKKIIKYKQDLSKEKEKLAEKVSKNQRKLDLLTWDCQRVERQYNVLQKQFEHFKTADIKKYEAVKVMHQDEISALDHKTVLAWNSIQEEILGKRMSNCSILSTEKGMKVEDKLNASNKNNKKNNFQDFCPSVSG